MVPNRNEIELWFKSLQNAICNGLEELDGKVTFEEDLWSRPGGGGGRTRVIQNGNVFEKGGVNFSAVEGRLPENIQAALGIDSNEFYATGISIVIHPKNPNVPIIHMNTRYFEIDDKVWWFGGGIDLTPIYIVEEEAKQFHQTLKDCCDKFDPNFYIEHKKWADDYFFIKHRNETRGIGGIFFDRMKGDKQDLFNYVKDVGSTFLKAYSPIVLANKNKSYTEEQKTWQLIRRGRYVEFNLVYDKGTRFGLDTSGRIESILMSLPDMASWKYNFEPKKGSSEEKTLSLLKKGINWA
ncbi:MAG: oxygen-dependent coproporphyrinogen oxidase [Salibacteraceae bacterium]